MGVCWGVGWCGVDRVLGWRLGAIAAWQVLGEAYEWIWEAAWIRVRADVRLALAGQGKGSSST